MKSRVSLIGPVLLLLAALSVLFAPVGAQNTPGRGGSGVNTGGTGRTTLTAFNVLVGNGAGAVALVPGGTNCVLLWTSASGNPSCVVTSVAAGGTGLTTATAGTYLVATTTNTWAAVAPALIRTAPADQTAFSSSGGVFKMTGLGAAAAACTITPVATGRVVFTIAGDIVNNSTATTVSIKMAEGTGAAPANQAAATGTVVSSTMETDQVTSVLKTTFTLVGTATGLALSTAVWFDLQLTTSGANTGQPANVTCVAHEI